ncbi:MAG: hypothetical protein K8R34_17165 [Methanosarcinales archaeon]|nr:hypothetical protein [Methanosarcinales archaeon]MCD4799809.1 hypothetical protein [Methanosarcinales archaeon]
MEVHFSSTTPTSSFTPTSSAAINYSVITTKSSESAPVIYIDPIKELKLPNGTFYLISGSAISNVGVESVTVNGEYAGNENWEFITNINISGDNNVVITALANDGNNTENVVIFENSTHESNFTSLTQSPTTPSYNQYFIAGIAAVATIIAAIIIYYKKK